MRADRWADLAAGAAATPEIDPLRLLDAPGRLVATSLTADAPPVHLSDRTRLLASPPEGEARLWLAQRGGGIGLRDLDLQSRRIGLPVSAMRPVALAAAAEPPVRPGRGGVVLVVDEEALGGALARAAA